MSTALISQSLTLEDVDALPTDGKDRDLIRGEFRERTTTRRNRWHSRIEGRIVQFLNNWLDTQPVPLGQIVSGEAGFRLQRNPETGVGIDIAYVSAELAAHKPSSPYFEGAPILAVEILSPSDKQEEIDEKVELYLACGVHVVWIVNPRLQTATVFRTDASPSLFSSSQILDAEPHLPERRVPVSQKSRFSGSHLRESDPTKYVSGTRINAKLSRDAGVLGSRSSLVRQVDIVPVSSA